jgi:hypothetical protein
MAVAKWLGASLDVGTTSTRAGRPGGATRKRFGDESDVQTIYLIVEPGTDSTTPGALSLSVYVSSDYGGGSVVFADDETPKRLDLPT